MLEYLNVDEIANMLRVNPTLVKDWIKNGYLKAINFGTNKRAKWKVLKDDLNDFIKFITEKGFAPQTKKKSINDLSNEELEAFKHEILKSTEIGSRDCWNWVLSKNNQGNGIIRIIHNGKSLQFASHRMSYVIWKGKIPECQCVLHKCHNPSCCNPHHLEVGTYKQNSIDAAERRKGIDHLKIRNEKNVSKNLL